MLSHIRTSRHLYTFPYGSERNTEILKFAVSDNLLALHFYAFSTGYIGERQINLEKPLQSSPLMCLYMLICGRKLIATNKSNF